MNMLGETTIEVRGAKEVPIKSTGHEKARVSVCLTAKGDGIKCKPFIVFKSKKKDVKRINEDKFLASKCYVATTENGWMTEESTLLYRSKILGGLAFQQRLLAWDTYECHMTKAVKSSLTKKRFTPVYIPGGCTGHIQAPDVSWNKVIHQF